MSTKVSPNRVSGIYAITDPELCATHGVVKSVEQCLIGGIQWVQYRDKTATDIERLKTAQSLVDLANEHGAQLIINDEPELAARTQASGVHIGQGDGRVQAAREQLTPEQIIGVTCHNQIALAQQAQNEGVDYVAFGRLFPSHTKPNASACSIDELQAGLQLGLPSVAIGGITLENMDRIIATGVQSIALIHGIFGARDIRARAKDLVDRFGNLAGLKE